MCSVSSFTAVTPLKSLVSLTVRMDCSTLLRSRSIACVSPSTGSSAGRLRAYPTDQYDGVHRNQSFLPPARSSPI